MNFKQMPKGRIMDRHTGRFNSYRDLLSFFRSLKSRTANLLQHNPKLCNLKVYMYISLSYSVAPHFSSPGMRQNPDILSTEWKTLWRDSNPAHLHGAKKSMLL